LKIETERLEDCQMALTIEVDEKRTKRALRSAARRISRQANIPGFRPGKAPYRVIAGMFGKEALYQEVVDELGNILYKEALEETGLEPFDQAQLADYETDPLVLKLIVPLAPVVELGDYRQLRVEPEEETMGDKKIDEALKRIQEENTFWDPTKGPAQWGNLAVVDIEGTLEGDTVVEDKGRELILEEADSPDSLPPGLSVELLGISFDQPKEFTLTYPEEYEDSELAGQQVHFTIHLQDLKEEIVPDIDDDLARTVGDYDTLEDLKAELDHTLQARAKEDFANRALEALVEMSKIEFPPTMREREIDHWVRELDQNLRRQGLNLNNYLQMRKLTEDEFRQEVSPQVEERLKRSLALGKLAELEGLDKSGEVVSEALERLAAIARGELEEEEDEFSEEKVEPLKEEESEPSAEEIVSEEETQGPDQQVVENESERSEIE
jgi:trigger factor